MDAHSVTLGDYRHRYYASIAPDAPHRTVIALHGFGLDGVRSFHSVAPLLQARGITLYALDLLGFGASDAPERVYSLSHYAMLVVRFAASLSTSAPLLLGHSMGGKIAAATAVLRPRRFRHFLLVNPGGFSWMAPWLPLIASTRWVNAALRQRWVQRWLLPRLPMGRILARSDVTEQALRLRDSHYAMDLDATDLRRRLHAIDKPIGVIWGCGDPLLPPSTLDRLRADLPQAVVYRLPQAGHIPMWDDPAAFADRVDRFLTQAD